MAAMPYEFHPDAQTEVEESGAWYAGRDLAVADRFYLELSETIVLICQMPDAWPTYLHGTHRHVLNDFPFSLVYREKAGVIQLIALAHHRRKPGYWTERLDR